MFLWISVSFVGLIFMIYGFVIFQRKYSLKKQIPNSVIILGICMPMLLALFYSETLIELIPQITFIDLGALFIIGMISGFFISIYLIQHTANRLGNYKVPNG